MRGITTPLRVVALDSVARLDVASPSPANTEPSVSRLPRPLLNQGALTFKRGLRALHARAFCRLLQVISEIRQQRSQGGMEVGRCIDLERRCMRAQPNTPGVSD